MTYRKKLIEVALPLKAINEASVREKSIRHGHPSTLHLWWARRPLATCRAVLFASLVDDPSEHPEEFPTEQEQERERDRLFKLIEQMVLWENSNNEEVLTRARAEIFKSTGSIPLEAQRLGLEAHASDLNPVAVLINKALIEIPPKFAGFPPVNPEAKKSLMGRDWHGAQGLADDIRYYGKWMRDEAEKRIGHLYPKVTLPKKYGGGEATVIAWLWARTVTCPNPACGTQMPLVRSFWLSTKKGKEAWIEPLVDKILFPPVIRFSVKSGVGKPIDGTVSRQGAICIACGMHVTLDYIRAEGKAGRMDAQLMAIVAESNHDRIFLPPYEEQMVIVTHAEPKDVPDTDLPEQALGFRVQLYGMTKHRHLFTSRQLTTLTILCDLVSEIHNQVIVAASTSGMIEDNVPLDKGGIGTKAYSDAVAIYLAFAIDKMITTNISMCAWQTSPTRLVTAFGRQAIPMVWDYAEANPFSGAAGDYKLAFGSLTEVLDRLLPISIGTVLQEDATLRKQTNHYLVSTDPPYYDNIGYADLSDFFYIWLRRSLRSLHSDLFRTLLVPKTQELIATPFRFGGNKDKARHFFEEGLSKAFIQTRECQHPDYPLTMY
jgi:putative DNA methylase